MSEFLAGENIKITIDGDKTIISAPQLSNTNIKNGPFMLSGQCVEIEAGKNIKISTSHPNKMIIEADFAKELVRIVDLETRIASLEKVIASLLRKKNDDQS
jgi:hypothetical protein